MFESLQSVAVYSSVLRSLPFLYLRSYKTDITMFIKSITDYVWKQLFVEYVKYLSFSLNVFFNKFIF